VEENIFNDCPGSLIFFLGERGRNGGDWVTSYPVATTDWGGQSNPGQGHMIVNSFAPIGPADRSSVGSSNLIARNNTFNGNSRYVGYLLDSGINLSTEANMSTVIFSGDTYSAAQTNGSYFIWGYDTQNYSQWQSDGLADGTQLDLNSLTNGLYPLTLSLSRQREKEPTNQLRRDFYYD
jgi:hypothetical protein